jgi:hypothetical protein
VICRKRLSFAGARQSRSESVVSIMNKSGYMRRGGAEEAAGVARTGAALIQL